MNSPKQSDTDRPVDKREVSGADLETAELELNDLETGEAKNEIKFVAGYLILRQPEYVPDIDSTITVLKHIETGLTVISIENDDPCLRTEIAAITYPEDDSGIFHVKEHCQGASSPKYPFSSTIHEIGISQIHSELNAYTSNNTTRYVGASKDRKAHDLIADVNLSCFFDDQIPEDVFKRQCGFLQPTPDGKAIIFKGIVHDEMKGILGDTEIIFHETRHSILFKDSAFGYCSGGLPEVMRDLEYQAVREAHAKYYTPENSAVIFYGNSSLADRTEFLNQQLEGVKADGEKSSLPEPCPLPAKRIQTAKYPAPPEASKESDTFNEIVWKFPHNNDHMLIDALSVLCRALAPSDTSPITAKYREWAEEKGLPSRFDRAYCYQQGSEIIFCFRVAGSNPEEAGANAEFFRNALATLAAEGIPQEVIEAAITSMQYTSTVNRLDPRRGKGIVETAINNLGFGFDIVEPFKQDSRLAELSGTMAKGESILEQLITDYLLPEDNRICISYLPDPEYWLKKHSSETEWIQSQVEQIGIEEVLREAERLIDSAAARPSEEQRAALPISEIGSELRRQKKILETEETVEGITVHLHPYLSEGLLTINFDFDCSTVDPEDLPYLGLFGYALITCGNESISPAKTQLLQKKNSRSGINYGLSVTPSKLSDRFKVSVNFGAQAKPEHHLALLQNIKQLLCDTVFQNQRSVLEAFNNFRDYTYKTMNSPENIDADLNRRLHSPYATASAISDSLFGAHSLPLLDKLIEEIDKDWEAVKQRLERLRGLLIAKSNLEIVVIVDQENWPDIKGELTKVVSSLPEKADAADSQGLNIPDVDRKPVRQGICRSIEANFVGAIFDFAELDYNPGGNGLVAGSVLFSELLFPLIRERGQAYGARVFYNDLANCFVMRSYRDPNILETIETYRKAADFLINQATEQDLARGIVSTINSYSPDYAPWDAGNTATEMRKKAVSYEDLQQIRNEVLSTTLEDLREFGRMLEAAADNMSLVIFSTQEKLEEVQASGKLGFDIELV